MPLLPAFASNKVAGHARKILGATIGDGVDSNFTANGAHLVGLYVSGAAGIDVGANREIERRWLGTRLACLVRSKVHCLPESNACSHQTGDASQKEDARRRQPQRSRPGFVERHERSELNLHARRRALREHCATCLQRESLCDIAYFETDVGNERRGIVARQANNPRNGDDQRHRNGQNDRRADGDTSAWHTALCDHCSGRLDLSASTLLAANR